MAKRTELPSYLRDPHENRFLVSLLEKDFAPDDNEFARIGNAKLAAMIEETKAFFPEQQKDGETGGNAHGGDGDSGNVTAFADRVGA
jgi:hypothetical protein